MDSCSSQNICAKLEPTPHSTMISITLPEHLILINAKYFKKSPPKLRSDLTDFRHKRETTSYCWSVKSRIHFFFFLNLVDIETIKGMFRTFWCDWQGWIKWFDIWRRSKLLCTSQSKERVRRERESERSYSDESCLQTQAKIRTCGLRLVATLFVELTVRR